MGSASSYNQPFPHPYARPCPFPPLSKGSTMSVFDLWLPILLAGLATHVISTLAWTVLPHHKPEWGKLSNEDDVYEMLSKKVPVGQYVFPYTDSAEEMKSEAFRQKAGKCSGMLIIWPNQANMGKAIGLTLLAFMVIAFVIGYVASLGLERGETFMNVFRFVTPVGLLAYISAKFPMVFWFRRKILMDVLDGVAFALATGLIFAALWPK